jgi:hypothetical protein
MENLFTSKVPKFTRVVHFLQKRVLEPNRIHSNNKVKLIVITF